MAINLTRRLFDLLFSAIMIVLSTPVVLMAALAIRLETKGNPFFSQIRIGVNGKPFRIFKLRGMYEDARTRFPELYDYSKHGSLHFYFHYKNDPRVTRMGSIFRSMSVDELPNFLNVFMGDMTLVGPRPEVPEVQALYGKYKDDYLSVKPGLTCLSKISGRDRLTKFESIQMDLDYINRRSAKLDLHILGQTVKQVLFRRNVYFGRGQEVDIKQVGRLADVSLGRAIRSPLTPTNFQAMNQPAECAEIPVAVQTNN